MKISTKALLIIFLLLAGVVRIQAQIASRQKDTQEEKLKTQDKESDTKDQIIKEDDKEQAKKSENNSKAVKQVKSARPDMSRSRGARPPDIVRPSGSRIPKGVGRPAGAGRHGR